MNALKSHFQRTFSPRMFALGFAALAACVALTSCEAPGGPLPPENREPFEVSAPVIDNASLYGEGESIPMPANVPGRTGQFTNEEVNLFYPQLRRTAQLPEGVAAADFAPTVLEEASRSSLQERFGFAPDADGNLPTGCSYVQVTAKVQNTLMPKRCSTRHKGRLPCSTKTERTPPSAPMTPCGKVRATVPAPSSTSRSISYRTKSGKFPPSTWCPTRRLTTRVWSSSRIRGSAAERVSRA